jgi:hypothetical protein
VIKARPAPGLALPTSWAAITHRLAALADRQLFFLGGAPRSGTTWLQQMLDAHPDVACRGEGLFLHHLAVPLEQMMAERAKVIDSKNRELFSHTGGFPQFAPAGTEYLVGAAILLAMDRFGEDCRAVGEKTPENVFFFPRLLALFPHARFIAIARDPRDVLSSAWHFFGKRHGQSLADFVRAALPSMDAGARAMLAFAEAQPAHTMLVTYEALRRDPAPVLTALFALLGVATDARTIAHIVARTDFSAATGGRMAGIAADGSFFRRGIVGDWRQTFTPEVEDLVLDALGWMFPRFGWER